MRQTKVNIPTLQIFSKSTEKSKLLGLHSSFTEYRLSKTIHRLVITLMKLPLNVNNSLSDYDLACQVNIDN